MKNYFKVLPGLSCANLWAADERGDLSKMKLSSITAAGTNFPYFLYCTQEYFVRLG